MEERERGYVEDGKQAYLDDAAQAHRACMDVFDVCIEPWWVFIYSFACHATIIFKLKRWHSADSVRKDNGNNQQTLKYHQKKISFFFRHPSI